MDKSEKIADLKSRNLRWDIIWDAVALIADQEDCALISYKCPAGVWTNGWGETDGVAPGQVWTKEYADTRFNESVNARAAQVRNLCTADTNPNQLGALVSLAYNIGVGGLQGSTVLKAHNAGNTDAAARAFQLWNMARISGVLTPLPDLTARRAAEAALYLKPEDSSFAKPSVQAVSSESPIHTSPIAITSVTTVVTGLAATVGGAFSSVAPIVQQAKSMADSIGVNPLFVLGAIVGGCGAISLFYRIKQRVQGWA